MKIQLRKLLLVTYMFLALSTQGQIKYGVRGGLNLASMAGSNIYNNSQEYIPSLHLGGFADYNLSNVFSFETGLLLSGKGTKFNGPILHSGIISDGKLTFSPLYLEVPINAVYNIPIGNSKLFFSAGPYIGVGIGGNISEEYSEGGKNVVENFAFHYGEGGFINRFDAGLNFGLGLEYKKFQLRTQYGLGLLNIDPGAGTMKNYVIGISLGYIISK